MLENPKITDVMQAERDQTLKETMHHLYGLAQAGHPLANFHYAKEMFHNYMLGRFNYLSKSDQKKIREMCLEQFHSAASRGVNSAYFYLGMIYMEGNLVAKDPEKAIDYYI